MAKQLNVSLAFTADTSQAKMQLQDLQNQLNKITTGTKIGTGIEADIQGAIKAASELSVHLKKATNLETGNLDFAKFNRSLQQSGMSLQQYGASLQRLGPQGQQAFMSLAQSVATAEIPIRRSNALVKELGTTLANTARWQLSSSMLHGFMSAVQSAYGYAQDLNESLNNIRIVTGQNIDQMAKFAQEANKAARALSATTTDYTNASLIYYQQGLNDQQVKERTNITIKMANVARESAEVVSDQMTAVWNNFYDGSKSLEHYADVMTALGAATASSTDEIAGGLEKFAAIGNTIGLSFEYAASALATITSNTRQSEEVVGTALKTIFARIQGLKLGESLEDGTDLNKYSEALQKVGISIYDSSGELKKMDNILDEMAAKWGGLSKAQQAALAQTVAGVRQYTQLIALMENWDNGDSDSMMANLTTSATSAGALQEQADIYAESWEAAQDRVTAALEAIYSSLIEDEAFIGLLNGVEKVINFVDKLIDSLGGLKGTLAAIGTIVTKMFSQQLSQGLSNLAYNIKMSTKKGRAAEIQERDNFINNAVDSIPQNTDYTTQVELAQQDSMRSQLTLQQEMLANADKMSTYEFERNKMLLDRNRLMQENVVEAAKEKQLADEAVDSSKYKLQSRIYTSGDDLETKRHAVQELNNNIEQMRASSSAIVDINEILNQFISKADRGAVEVSEMRAAILSLDTSDQSIKDLISDFGKIDLSADNAEQQVRELVSQIQALTNQNAKNLKNLIPFDKNDATDKKAMRAEVDGLVQSIDSQTSAERRRSNAVREGANSHQLAADSLHNYKGAQKTWADIVVESANLVFSAAMAFQMLGSAFDTLQDPDVSGWEKLSTILMTLGMTIPMLVSAWSTLKSLISAETVSKIANVAATIAQVGAEKALNKEKGLSHETTKRNKEKTDQDTKEKLRNIWDKKSKANWDKADDTVKDRYREKYLQSQGYKRSSKMQKGSVYSWHKGDPKTAMTAKDIAAQNPAVDKGASKLFTQAGAKSLSSVGLSVAAIAAGIAVIAGGIAWGIKQANKAEEAIEKAKDRVKELEANLETVKSSYSEFQSNVSAFESAEKGIEGLTKGTKEYSQAVYEANQAAMALIESNKDLKYSVKDGVITFDEGELDRALKKQQDAVLKSQAAKMLGDQAVTQAEQNKSVRDYSRTIDSKSDDGQNFWNVLGATATGAGGGALIGAGLGSLLGGGIVSWLTGPIGAAIGAVVGGIGGLVTGLVGISETGAAVTAEAQALEKLATAYQLDSSILAKETDGKEGSLQDYLSKSVEEGGLGIDDEDLVNALSDDVEATRALLDEIARNTAAINAQNDQIAASALGDEEFIQQSEYGDAIIDRSGDAYGNMVNDILNSEAMQQWGAVGISKASGASDEAEDVFQEYLKAAGLDNQGYKLKDTKGTDKNREFVYLDADGNEKTVSLDTMRYTMASAQALERLEQIAAEMALDFHKWAEDKTPTSQAMLSFLSTGNFGDATKGEFDAINSAVTSAGGSEEYLKSIFGEDLESTAEKYGYDSAESFINAFEVAISNGAKDWSNIKIPGVSDESKQNLNLSDAKEFEATVDFMNTNTAEGAGEKAGEKFLKGLNNFIAEMDPADQEEAWTKIAQIDWTQFDAGYQVIDIFEDMGYTISEEALPAFEQWVSETNTATLAVFDFGAAMKEIAAVKDIIKDIDLGSIISKEDYDTIVEYNKELAKYFSVLATGEARFIGDKLDFQQAVEQEEKDTYKKAITDTKTSYDNVMARKDRQDLAEEYGGYSNLSVQAGSVSTKTVQTHEDATWLDKLYARVAAAPYGSSGPTEYSNVYDEALDEATATTETVEVFEKNVAVYEKQIAFLNKVGADLSDINTDSATYTEDDAKAVVTKISQYAEQSVSEEELNQAIATMNQSQLEYARTAEDPEEREAMVEEGLISEQIAAKAAMEAHQTEKWEDMDPDKVEEYADSLMDAAKSSSILSDELKTNEEAAEDVALYTQKMNKGIDKLADGFDDWSDVLNNSSKESDEYNDAMDSMKNAMSDVLGVSEDFLSDDFIVKNMKDIELAAQGDADAIDRLAIAAGKDIITHMEIEGGEEVKNEVLALHDQLAAEIPNIEVGATLNDGDFMTKAAQIVEKAGMSVEQANAYFRGMGFEPTFETKTVPITRETKAIETTTEILEWGEAPGVLGGLNKFPTKIRESSQEVSTGTVTEDMEVPALTTDGGKPNFTLTRTNAGSMNNYSGSNSGGKSPGSGSGGGGSKPKKTSEAKKNKSEVVDRYKEINDQLEKTTRQMNKNTIAADGLWGSKRIAMLKKNIDLMKQECKQLEEKHKLSIKYLSEDKKALEEAASEVGISFDFDANGTITNYTSEMTALFNKREALLKSFGDTMDEDEEERLTELDDKIEAVKSAYEQYETTLDERDDFEEERLQKILDTQTAYYDMLNEELEIKISIDEDALATIEYYLSKIEDDFYQMFEAAALMIGDASSLEQGQIKHYLSEIDSQQKYVEDLDKAHTTIDPRTKETEINDAQYMEGLRQAKTDTIASLQALQDLDKTMMHYYGDTLAAASEELSKYTTLMEHQTSVLDHYKNIMDILGQSKDYKKMGIILDAQAKIIGNEAKVAKENYNMLKEQAEARKAEYDQAIAQGLAQSEIDAYKQRWMDAENAANEAQENMLSKTEAWAEAMKAVVENKLNDLDQTLENALTADFGGSFDLMNSAFERANSLQEEFLTTTNKIYETNKLMRQAQQEIDKISNEVAKKRLKQFINETNQLQNKNKLSNYELEIQQAKYDLALAQIALEEAQNAKSTVRLQRDAEGNFGYVYTADQNAVAEAQQKFEDAQNSLYNIGLEGANSYAEKYQQTLSEFYSTMTELQHQYLNGEFENEAEYQEAMLAAREYYYEKLQQYSSLYTVAISTDTRVVADAWSTQYANMTQNTEEWMFNVDSYVEGVKVAFGEWEAQMAQIEEETIGPDLDALTERTQTLTTKSQKLADTILGKNGVLNAIEQEVTQVAELTGAYAGLREEIQEAIRQREELIRQIDERIQNENEGEDGDGSGGGGDSDGSGGGGDGSGGGSGNLDPKDASTKRGVALAIWNGSYGWGSGKTRKDRLKEKGFNPDEIQDLVNNTDPSAGWGSRYGITDLSKYAYSKFDTGGYTGAWGANGKFAMLHEKELVLNKGDTENFLASMELLDTIVKTIDLHSTNAALGGLLNSPYLNGMNNNEVLEQNVTIEANFPNVSSRTEIEEAFTTLVNRASQYANRK